MKKVTLSLAILVGFLQILTASTPVINCTSDISVAAQTGACGAQVMFEISSEETCPGEIISQSMGLPSGATFPVGTTVNTFVVTDDNGNTDMCTFTVTVVDDQAPAFVCPSNITVAAPQFFCEQTVNFDLPFISDNCNANEIVLQHNNSNSVSSSFVCDSLSASSHLRVFNMNDFGVPSATQVTSVDVGIGFSNNNPSITINMYTLEGNFSYDNMTLLASETVTVPNLFNSILNVPFSTIIPYGAVVVVELQAPGFAGNTIPGYNFGLGQSAPSYIFDAACGHIDPVDLASIGEPELSLVLMVNTSNTVIEQTGGLESGAVFPIGTTTNTFVATDAAGNTAMCNFDVTVIDEEAPLLVCPTNLEVQNDPSVCGAIVEYEINTVENCPNETITLLQGLPSGSLFPVGTTLNIYRVEDVGGLVDTCRFDVKVVDTEAPNAICPNHIIQATDAGSCSAVVEYTVSGTDNCSDVNIQQISGLPSGFTFPLGTITNTFVVTDAVGLSDTCSFDVTIVNETLPTIETCPEDKFVFTETGTCSAVVTYETPTFSSDCGIIDYSLKQHLDETVTSSYGCANDAPSSHLRVFDLNSIGIAAELDVDSVTVGIGFTDNNPELGLNIYLLEGELLYDNMTLLASTSAAIPDLFNKKYTFPIDATIPSGSVVVVELTTPQVTDAALIVGYNEAPESNSSYYASEFCFISDPQPLSNFGISNLSLIMEVHAQGLAEATLNQVSGLPSGSTFPLGTTTNTFEVMDAQGNVESCTFDIVVSDGEAPVLSCGSDISVLTTAVTCDTMVMVETPTIMDNCSGMLNITNNYTNTDDASAVYPAGNTIVIWTATDATGNTSTCAINVMVNTNSISADVVSTPVTCANGSDGTISVTPQTGEAPFSIQWSNGATDTMLDNLTGGIYTVSLTDATGCMFIGDIQVEEPDQISLDNNEITDALDSANNGAIDITISGGTPPYTYLWSNGATTEDIENLAAGNYLVTITDANNCEAIFIDLQVDMMVATEQSKLIQSINVTPNPAIDEALIAIELEQSMPLNIQVFNTLGQIIHSIPTIKTNTINQRINISNWATGLYFIQFKTENQTLVTKRLMVGR